MKNPLISLLSRKQNYLTSTGKIDFLIELNRKAMELGSERVNKHRMLDSIRQKKSSRFTRGIIYQQKKFLGLKYRSFVDCEDFYQIPLMKLGKHTLDLAAKNNLLSIEYIHELNMIMSNLHGSLKSAQCIEEKEVLLSW